MKRLKLNQLNDPNIPRDVIYLIIQELDARDAMSLAATSKMQTLATRTADFLKQDKIWKFWFERDMPEMYKELKGKFPDWYLLSKERSSGGDLPEWKVIYLWYRLVYSYFEWDWMKKQNDFGFGEVVYPIDNDDLFVAYRKFFTQNQLIDHAWIFGGSRPATVASVQQWAAPRTNQNVEYLVEILNLFGFYLVQIFYPDRHWRTSAFSAQLKLAEKFHRYLVALPRFGFEGVIAVGCNFCLKRAKFMCPCGDVFYCGKECQKEDWSDHNHNQLR